MMALWFGRRGAVFRAYSAFVLTIGIAALGVPADALAADITVVLDQAQLVKLPDKVSTVVIGNPSIADASVQAGGTMVITGKGYGVTNVILLDRAGTVLMEKSVEVRGAGANVIVVYRGVDQFTYSCTPVCQRRVTLGDAQPQFDTATGQTAARNGLAQGAATAAPTAR
jgi:hypothetical protein